MSAVDIELQLTTEASAQPIHNLYPLYLHDIAGYEARKPNKHGVLHVDDEPRTWREVMETQRAWWSNPDYLFPYLVRVDGVPAGFSLISSGPYVPTPGTDFVVHEFFIAHAFRGTGVAAEAVLRSVTPHRGSWEVVTWPNAARAIAFWRKALPPCAHDGHVVETEENHAWGRKVAFRFDNLDRADR